MHVYGAITASQRCSNIHTAGVCQGQQHAVAGHSVLMPGMCTAAQQEDHPPIGCMMQPRPTCSSLTSAGS